jgi:hypothetical protein
MATPLKQANEDVFVLKGQLVEHHAEKEVRAYGGKGP